MNSSFLRRLKHLQRWESGTVRLLGLIEIVLGVALGLTGTYAFLMGEDAGLYCYLFPVVLGLGIFQLLFFSSKSKMPAALGVLLIAEMWAISFVVAAIPFMLYGFSPEDAFFEGISGYTTTGATVIPDLNQIPSSLLLWRGIIQWAGGLTVLISFSFLLPMIGMGGAGLNSNEFAGSDNEDYSMKISSASLNFIKVYILLTVAEIICLMCCHVASFDSVCIAFSNIPTGGLLPRNDSMVSYGLGAQAVTLVFMILGSANFYMMFRLFFKGDLALFKNKETRVMLEWFIACALLIFASYFLSNQVEYTTDSAGHYFWISLYSAISCGTGTGFGIVDFVYPQFIFLILMIMEFMGGASGSTAGGIKIYRMMALKSYVVSNLNKVMHPNAVTSIRADGRNWSESAVNSALATILLFLMGVFISLAILMFIQPNIGEFAPAGIDELQAYFGIILAGIANAGIGPLPSYDVLNFGAKILMCFLMWFGRMEMVLVIILFTKSFWTEVGLNVGQVGRARSKNRHFRKG